MTAGWMVAVACGAQSIAPSDAGGHVRGELRVEQGRFFLPPGRYALGAAVSDVCRAVEARLVAEEGVLDATVATDLPGCTAEIALARLLAGVSHTIAWRRDPTDGAGTNWIPAEVRIGRSIASTVPDPVTPRPMHLSVPNDIAALADALADRAAAPASRLAAAHALVQAGNSEAANLLLDALAVTDPDETDRRIAAIVASDLGATSAVPALAARAFDDRHPLAQSAAMAAMARLADGSTLAELERAHHAAPESRAYRLVLEIIQRSACPAAEPQLHAWADEIRAEPDSARAAAALRGLASVGTGPAVDSLFQRWSESPPSERPPAILAALDSVAPTPEGLASLQFAAEGNRLAPDDDPRLAALDSLARFPDAATVDLLRRLAERDTSAVVRERAGVHLRRILGGPAD